MTTTNNIHRYLDEAFADIPRTPENADLKEEIRGNLASRVAELEAAGTKPDAAAAKAIKELGDIHAVIQSIGGDESATRPGDTANRLISLNKVRIDPSYVVRTVIFSLVLAVMLALVVVTAVFGPDAPGAFRIGSVWFAVALGALLAGIIVTDGLRQETSQHYPAPTRRAFAYGGATILGLAGLDEIGLFIGGRTPQELLSAGVTATLLSLIAFIWLGVTQTNRQKPWVRDLNSAYSVGDRFSEDPASAARFGLYTVVIWVVAIAVFIVLSITVGFAWSWLSLVSALVVFFLVLARMLFPASDNKK